MKTGNWILLGVLAVVIPPADFFTVVGVLSGLGAGVAAAFGL